MTDWEVHDLGVEIVRAYLEEHQKTVLSWQPSSHINPSIVYTDGKEHCWAIVRTARFPDEPAPPANVAGFVAMMNLSVTTTGYFASVGVANSEQSEEAQCFPYIGDTP